MVKFVPSGPVARLKRLGVVICLGFHGSQVAVQTREKSENYLIDLDSTMTIRDPGLYSQIYRTGLEFSSLERLSGILVALLEADLTASELVQSLKIDGLDLTGCKVVRNHRGFYVFTSPKTGQLRHLWELVDFKIQAKIREDSESEVQGQ